MDEVSDFQQIQFSLKLLSLDQENFELTYLKIQATAKGEFVEA
jgi:hypothetical protein